MKKRLMTGLLAGGLMVGLLPGVASAEWPGERGDHGAMFDALVSCDTEAGPMLFVVTLFPAPAGVQGFVLKGLRADTEQFGGCVPGTVTHDWTKDS